MAGVAFNPDAKSPTYERFLGTIFKNDTDLIHYVKRFGGIILTGVVTGQTFHVFHGDGSNGKSVLLELWMAMLKDYGLKLPSQALVNDKSGSRHPCELADLVGIRIAVAFETDQSGRLNEALVKELTGGDTISARLMKQNFFRFEPMFKPVLCTNHKPRIEGNDHGIWRRIRLVPFAVKFWKDEERDADPNGTYDPSLKADPRMPEKLRTELEGILADCVREAVAFYGSGKKHEPPQVVRATLREYRESENALGQFAEEVLFADAHARTSHTNIYKTYSKWASDSSYRPVGKRALSDYLTTRYGEPKKSNGKSCYPVRLRNDWGDRE
jgi:putative DNA primase/helicase